MATQRSEAHHHHNYKHQNHNHKHQNHNHNHNLKHQTTHTSTSSATSSFIFFWLLVTLTWAPGWGGGGTGVVWRSREYPLIPWEDLWKEVDIMMAGKENCLPEFSHCWYDNNTTTTTPSTHTVHTLCRQCWCDSDCVVYGDCCRDKAQADWGDGREEDSGLYSCNKMSTMGMIGLLMVGSCRPQYHMLPINDLCTQQVSAEAYSYVLDLPVTSRVTNITYINYHCAVCNDDAQDLHIFNVTINCRTRQILKEYSMVEFMSKAQYLPRQRQFIRYIYRNAGDEQRFIPRETHRCTLEVAEFEDAEQFICYEQISQCDPAWPDLLDVEKCRRYSQVVVNRDHRGYNTFYKNPHCARCNFVNVSSRNLYCSVHEDRCNDRIREVFLHLAPSFSVLMDFRRDSCSSDNELWDPFHRECKKIFCGKLYKLTNGECVKDSTAASLLGNSTLLDDSCPKVMLTADEYVLLGNGSLLVVNATKKLYNEGEYEMESEEIVYICNEEHLYLSGITQVQELLTAVTLVTSLAALALHITIFLLVPRLRNLPGKNLFCLTCCLFMAHLVFLTGTRATDNHGFCVFISATLHFFWLASFTWMNVMSIDVCRTFTNQLHPANSGGHTTYIFYSTYAWSVPLLVVILALVFQYVDILPGYQPDYATKYCWINNRYGLALFFLLPQGAIILENTVLFFLTACGIYKQAKAARYANTRSQSIKKGKNVKMHGHREHTQSPQERRRKKNQIRLVLYMKLGLIQGLSWITGFVVAFIGVQTYWYPFIILNGLQGAFIFIAFDMKRKVWESVWESVMGRPWKQRTSSKDTRVTTTGRGSSHNNNSRSSKSNSDIDGETKGTSSSVRQWIAQEDSVGQQSGSEDIIVKPTTTTTTTTTTTNTTTTTPKRTSFVTLPPTQECIRTIDSKQSEDDYHHHHHQHSLNLKGGRKMSHYGVVKNGDLRASVVRGKFEGESTFELPDQNMIKPQKTKVDPNNSKQRTKPDLQRVMDLLQQLEQSQSSVDLPDLVQQLLLKSGGSSSQGEAIGKQGEKQVMRQHGTPGALTKCRSFTEGADPQVEAEQHDALTARLRLLEYSRQCPGIHSLISSHGQPWTTSPVPCLSPPPPPPAVVVPKSSIQQEVSLRAVRWPESVASTSTNSHNNSLRPTKYHTSQPSSEENKMATNRHGLGQSEEVHYAVHNKMPKSRSFSQISQVALAAAILQRAAADACERRQRGEERQRPTFLNTPIRTSESLV
ncbi:hypothetical protein Pcinc_026903 [Petrolisthes cinctipes]|uniref:G-protein coupled receptors family 2 profile 2 domain-containing protein n=1 Tax=Petrolisthes cinctipes TaxID=88211 RepID=A0AAE1F6H8_PETCI|nr:hypothetical protein Pcinc_026903 [Petrolisthes cinctipes]